jgi:hypothetical protein
VAVPLVHAQEDLVGQHVQRLLHLALHVDSPPAGGRVGGDVVIRAPEGDDARDRLAGQRHVQDQGVQVTAGVGEAAALLDQVARESPASRQGHGGLSMQVQADAPENTRLARMSEGSIVVRSSWLSTRSRSANSRLAWRRRAVEGVAHAARIGEMRLLQAQGDVFLESVASSGAEAVVHVREHAIGDPKQLQVAVVEKVEVVRDAELMPGLLWKNVFMRSA